jgi:hypothetical protein
MPMDLIGRVMHGLTSTCCRAGGIYFSKALGKIAASQFQMNLAREQARHNSE